MYDLENYWIVKFRRQRYTVSMDYYFEMSGHRTINDAGYNTFVRPALHPNRTMADHDFLYVIDGNWEIGLETESDRTELLQARTGDLVLLPAGMHHFGTAPCSPNCRNIYIHAEPLPADGPVSGIRETNGNEFLNNGRISGGDSRLETGRVLFPSVIHCAQNPNIENLFVEISAVYWSDSPRRQQKLSCLFELLLCEMEEQQEKSPAVFKHFAFVDSVSKFLQANPQKFYTAGEISARFYVSERTINNRFHEVCGKTLYAYQMEQKLEMVRQFIHTNPGLTLREVASNYGFYDEFHLSKAFKKHFGISPKYMR